VECVTKSTTIVFVIKSLQLETLQEYQLDLSITISPLNAQWRIGHQQVTSIPVGPLQAVKLTPR